MFMFAACSMVCMVDVRWLYPQSMSLLLLMIANLLYDGRGRRFSFAMTYDVKEV
jgi:hypothetical protein